MDRWLSHSRRNCTIGWLDLHTANADSERGKSCSINVAAAQVNREGNMRGAYRLPSALPREIRALPMQAPTGSRSVQKVAKSRETFGSGGSRLRLELCRPMRPLEGKPLNSKALPVSASSRPFNTEHRFIVSSKHIHKCCINRNAALGSSVYGPYRLEVGVLELRIDILDRDIKTSQPYQSVLLLSNI